jgi:hypothetical protein
VRAERMEDECKRTVRALVVSDARIRQHTSAYVSIRQHTSAYVSIRQHTPAVGALVVSDTHTLTSQHLYFCTSKHALLY